MKMGRWRSKTFSEYIREELGSFSDGKTKSMKKLFKYVNVSDDRYADVTDAVGVSDYEAGVEDEG